MKLHTDSHSYTHSHHHTLNCSGRLLPLDRTLIMGILNVTPDSFYAGSRYTETAPLLQQVEKMLQEGADIIDIGGMSSRPGANIVPIEEELQRVIPAIESIQKAFPKVLISIDTIHSQVAQKAVEAGASIINDISAGSIDEKMIPTVAQLKVPYVLMHMQGKPQSMQTAPHYEDLFKELLLFLAKKMVELKKAGIKDIIIDPGFGFGKTIEHNYQLLAQLKDFQILDAPIMVGLSRKSMIWKVLESSPAEALNGTTALHTIALLNGAQILRVHDVKAAKEVATLTQQYLHS